MIERTAQAVAIAIALSSSMVANASDWSDTWMGYQYQGNVREPANPNKIAKNVVEFGHASGYKYGSNFFAADLYISDGNDPANNGGGGAHEAYVVYRHNLSLSAVSGSKIAFGPVRDVSLMTGFNWSTKNDAFASQVRELMVGPTFHVDVKGGFWDLGLYWSRESNHNGIVGQRVRFKSAPYFSTAWSFGITDSLTFKGYGDVIGEKGADGFGAPTKTEVHFFPKLVLDVGQFAGAGKGALLAGFGVEYWRNKYGSSNPVGVDHTTPTLVIEAHF